MNGQGLRTIPLEDGSDGELLEEIDPFTFFANFNRPITEKNKARMWELVKSELNLNSEIPRDYFGLPLFNLQKPRLFLEKPRFVFMSWVFQVLPL